MLHTANCLLTDDDPTGNLIEYRETLTLLKTGGSRPDKEKTSDNDQQLYNHDGALRLADTVALLEFP